MISNVHDQVLVSVFTVRIFSDEPDMSLLAAIAFVKTSARIESKSPLPNGESGVN